MEEERFISLTSPGGSVAGKILEGVPPLIDGVDLLKIEGVLLTEGMVPFNEVLDPSVVGVLVVVPLVDRAVTNSKIFSSSPMISWTEFNL